MKRKKLVKMRILVNGLPFFSKKLVRDLNVYDAENSYIFCDTYSSKWAQMKFSLLLPFCGAVISSRGVTTKSNSLDLAVKFKKKMVMQWHGTDVKQAVENHRNNKVNHKYIDHSTHITSAPWFEKELEGIVNVFAYTPFGYVTEAGNDSKYDSVKVLTYLAEGREEFYGWKQIQSLAQRIPELEITVVGSKGESFEKPENVKFLGWVDEAKVFELMKHHAIYVRLTEHDGKSISVSQALGAGCEVVWSYEIDRCHFAETDIEKLEHQIRKIKASIEERGLLPNKENIVFAKDNLNKDVVMTRFVEQLKGALNE